MNKKHIESLAEYIEGYRSKENTIPLIREWFERHPQKPVGLTDEQVERLGYETFQFTEEFFCENEDIATASDHVNFIKGWLKHEDFVQPKEVPVGLSDIQIESLGASLQKSCGKTWVGYYQGLVANWLKTQTFAKPVEITNVELGDAYQALMEDFQALELKCGSLSDALLEIEMEGQKFQPDWSTAPEWANWLAQDENGRWCFYDMKPETNPNGQWKCTGFGRFANCEKIVGWENTLQQRPTPPAPKVEVGQEFKLRNICGYKVISVKGDTVRYEVEANGSKLVSERTIEDFLEKFEQVQS
jgi:hypothetical protein